MIEVAISTIVTFIVSTICGYLLGKVKRNKKDNELFKDSIKCLLRASMVNTYFAYKEIGSMPYYCKQAWYMMYEAYKNLDGNSFIDDIKLEVDKFEIKK